MAKVIKKFIDKKTKRKYRPGDEYEGTKARVEELAKLGFVESDGKQKAEPPQGEPPKDQEE